VKQWDKLENQLFKSRAGTSSFLRQASQQFLMYAHRGMGGKKTPKVKVSLGQIMSLWPCSFSVLVSGTVDRNMHNIRRPDNSEAAFVMR